MSKYKKYINYVVDSMVKETEIRSVDMEHDQVLPPWMKDINILPNLLEYDEWIRDRGNGRYQLEPVMDFKKHRNTWENITEHFYRSANNYINDKYGVPESMWEDVSQKYRKRLREVVNYHRIIK
jgi:hypothetical protein